MPEIKQYFAPIRRIAPSSAGEEAAQRLASAGERTSEAWVQAARRFGSLGTETADMLKQQGTLQRQDIESFQWAFSRRGRPGEQPDDPGQGACRQPALP